MSLCLSVLLGAQQTPTPLPDQQEQPFPETAKQQAAILKANHERNLKDLEKMARLVDDVQADARKNAQYVISLQSLKNLDQIEKLSRAIRQRMKGY